tara:strand:- start:2811 stop:3803 length:993 start_codon:yes stop_codon:yes gene_type:complete
MASLTIDTLDTSASDWTSSDVDIRVSNVTTAEHVQLGVGSMFFDALGSNSGSVVKKDLGAGNEIDLSSYNEIRFWVKSSVSAEQATQNWVFSFGESGYEENLFYIDTRQVDKWYQKRFWIKNISTTSRNAVRYFQFKCLQNTTSTLYIDHLVAVKEDMLPDVELAMKTKLANLGYPVYIRSPEEVIAQEGTYPSVGMYIYDISDDLGRGEHGAYVDNSSPDGSNYVVEKWGESTPYIVSFQVDTFCRYARDDRAAIQKVYTEFPAKNSYLEVNGRLLDVIQTDFNPQDDIVGTNRLYRKTYSMDVYTHLDAVEPVSAISPSTIVLDGGLQ